MDTGRDLGQVDLWQASLERSLARRNQPRQPTRPRRSQPRRPRRARSLGRWPRLRPGSRRSHFWASPCPACCRGRARFRGIRPRRPPPGSARACDTYRGFSPGPPRISCAHRAPCQAATSRAPRPRQPTLPDHRPTHDRIGSGASSDVPKKSRPASSPRPVHDNRGLPAPRPPKPAPSTARPPRRQPPPTRILWRTPASLQSGSTRALITPGSGTLDALGAAMITYLGTSNTGWPGAFIEFRLLNGPDSGRYVYYAETIMPAPGAPRRPDGSSRPGDRHDRWPGIEIGWGANIGTETYAAASDNGITAPIRAMSPHRRARASRP